MLNENIDQQNNTGFRWRETISYFARAPPQYPQTLTTHYYRKMEECLCLINLNKGKYNSAMECDCAIKITEGYVVRYDSLSIKVQFSNLFNFTSNEQNVLPIYDHNPLPLQYVFF